MADFFLHTQLLEDLYQMNPTYQNLDIAKIGAQGPDPFYYVISGTYKKSARQLADDMHDEKINAFLISFVNLVKDTPTETNKAFLIGFLGHFVLDVNIHPYIYYKTGVYLIDDDKTHKYRGYHLRFERSVDIAYIKHRYHKAAFKLHRRNRILPVKKLPSSILDILDSVGRKVYQIECAKKAYQKGYHVMRRLLNILIVDTSGIRKAILTLVDKLNPKSELMLQDYPYHNKDKKYDYLNLKKEVWHHPVTNTPSTETVLDLYQQALKELDHMVKAVLKYIGGDESIQLETLFKNRSFNSGMDTSKPRIMKYFKLYDKKTNISK